MSLAGPLHVLADEALSASQAKGEWSTQVRTMLEIAHACGYRLELARDDERIVLD